MLEALAGRPLKGMLRHDLRFGDPQRINLSIVVIMSNEPLVNITLVGACC
jgi:hypothetical protein